MQNHFLTIPYFKIFFVSLLLTNYEIARSIEPLEVAKENLIAIKEKVVQRFETKYNQNQATLDTCIAHVKAEPLYNELEKALNILHKEPTYELYQLITKVSAFIKKLESYNKTVIRPELLTQIHDLIEQLNTHENFTTLRSTLKKQRVAFLELFEEKELIMSVEKILSFQEKELANLLIEQQEKLKTLPSYQQAQEMQQKYLQTTSVKKLLSCIEKRQGLFTQQQSALLKSKEYQKALNTFQLLSFNPNGFLESPDKKQDLIIKLLQIQHELFIVPLENTI